MVREFHANPEDNGILSNHNANNYKRIKNRRRKKKPTHQEESQNTSTKVAQTQVDKPFIGEDLLDWPNDQDDTLGAQSSTSEKGTVVDESQALQISPANTLPKSRRALAIDTRVLDTNNARSISDKLYKEQEDFIRSLVRRGIAPTIFCSTTPSEKPASSKKISLGIRSETANKLENMLASKTPVVVKTPFLPKSTTKRGSEIPKALTAKWSWKVAANLGR